MSTISVPPFQTSARQDVIDLHKAFKGFGCDSETVINILAHRDATQRALIQQEYKIMYSEELTSRLSSELSGDNKKAMLLWILDPAGRDATVLRQAFTRDVADLYEVTEVICSCTPSQLQTIKQLYHSKFGSHLEHDVQFHTSGDHQKLLMAYIGLTRYEGPQVDQSTVTNDAKDLYKAGEKKLGTDEKVFIRVFSQRSWAHLSAVASAYHHIYGTKLEKVVKSETSGYFELALLTILRCAENPAKYFAKALHKSMEGMGTNDTALIRIVVTRTEIDMQYIKAEYHKKYKKTLPEVIHSEISGNYRKLLLSLIGPSH